MKNLLRSAVLALALLFAGTALAADIKDGNAMIKPLKGERFSIDGNHLTRAQLFGYISEMKESEGITGIVLRKGGDDAQRSVIRSIAGTLGLQAFEEEGRRQLKPLGPAPAVGDTDNDPDD